MNEGCILHQLKAKTSKEYSMEEILRNLMLFLIGGFDTVSSTMASVLYYLAKHPEERKKIHIEIEEVLKSDVGNISSESLDKMESLNMFIKEAQRLNGFGFSSFC